MKLNSNDMNFCAKYVLRGNCEEINKAVKAISIHQKDKVSFFPISYTNNKLVIVATNEDSFILKETRQEEDFIAEIKKLSKNKDTFLTALFDYIFKSSENVPILQDGSLHRFGFDVRNVDYENGVAKNNKQTERFIDGSIKKYTAKNDRLYYHKKADGTEISISPKGVKNIIHPDGKMETILPKYQQNKIATAEEQNKQTTHLAKEISPIKPEPIDENFIELPYKDGIMQAQDKNGKLRAFIFPNGLRKNFDENGNLKEVIHPNGKTELFTPEGRMYCIVHPDGTKEYLRRNRTSVFL